MAMKTYSRRFSFLLALSLGMASLLICSATADGVGKGDRKPKQSLQQTRPGQLIIKFKDTVSDPSRKEFVDELSLDAQTQMSYFRPMSGGAHVFRVDDNCNAMKMEEIVERLSKRPDVVYVEPDAIMGH